MHDLSLILGCMRSVICFYEIGMLEKMLLEMFSYCFNCEAYFGNW